MQNFQDLFELLKHWKKLPAYRAEPRIDWLVGFYMKEIISKYLAEPAVAIIPEFPIRVGTIYRNHDKTNHADRSYKVDFYVLLGDGRNIFVEFKTDSRSRRDKQTAYLKMCEKVGMKQIVNGVLQIASVSPYKTKYDYLLKEMSSIGLVSDVENIPKCSVENDEIVYIYLQPKAVKDTNSPNQAQIDFIFAADVIAAHEDPFSRSLSACLRDWKDD